MPEVKKKLNSPFCSNGVKHEGQKFTDNYYYDLKLVDKVKKIGDGDDDFIVVKRRVVSKTPIEKVVSVDKDNVGVYPILKQFARTGDESIIPMEKEASTVDLVGCPTSIMEMKQRGVDAEKAFAGLPKSLTQGMDMKAFVEGMSQEKFNEFVKALAERAQKKEVKKDE